MTALAQPGFLDRARLLRAADGLVVAIAVSLPWSTSATGILLVLWLLALIPTLDWADVRRERLTPAGGLPVLLVLLGALGMVWADVTWPSAGRGFEAFFKLLVIPLLFVQFRRSERGLCVFGGYCRFLRCASRRSRCLPNSFPGFRSFRCIGTTCWSKTQPRKAANSSPAFSACLFLTVRLY